MVILWVRLQWKVPGVAIGYALFLCAEVFPQPSTTLEKMMANSVIDHRPYLCYQAYRCALVTNDVYDLNSIAMELYGLPPAAEEQIQQIFPNSEDYSFFKENSEKFKTKLFFDTHDSRFILAFAGTDMSNTGDLLANWRQFIGSHTAHHQWALDLVSHMALENREKVIVTGHSLGGGLAAITALAGDMEAFCFNPTSVPRKTWKKITERDESRIHNYVVKGDILAVGRAFNIKNHILRTNILVGFEHTIQLSGSFAIPWKGMPAVSALFRRSIPVVGPIIAVGGPVIDKMCMLHKMEEVLFGLRNYFQENASQKRKLWSSI